MTTKHTPGPWSDCSAERPGAYHITSTHRHWSLASSMWTEGCSDSNKDIPQIEAKANSRLIAAAPELLEALKGLLADIEDYQRINNLGGEDNHWQVIARAVIAKAEGRT